MIKIFTLVLILLSSFSVFSQYDNYIGLGNDEGIQISSSDMNSDAHNTLNASGIDLDIQGASRFLAHATLSYTIEDIERLSETGFENWIDEQMNTERSLYAEQTVEIIYELYDHCVSNLGEIGCNSVFALNPSMFRYAWWDNAMRSNDKLRQKVALALSEILVISDQSDLVTYPHGIAAFYDILNKHAFGNYRDLLQDVSLNPSMGFYLSHINNPKTNEELNIHPDENYAREIMQLFTIGLYELNNDGSRKIDPLTGLWIPTYDNDDIKGLAKIFTGLSGSKWADPENQSPVLFGRFWARYSLLDPMRMYPLWHESGPKTIVGGHTIEGPNPMEEVNLALDHLFNHPNVGPFISYRLIQRLVKSNPSNSYIDRVASVFNDNGSGVRGDLAAVIKAILLDEEAMECWWFGDMTSGQLRPPIHRYTHLLSALKAKTEREVFWNSSYVYQAYTEQHPMSSPTVFNHYLPDYSPNEDFAYYDMVAPEMQILNSSTSSNYVNFILLLTMRDYVNDRYGLQIDNIINEAYLIPYIRDKSEYEAELTDPLWMELAYYPEELVDYLDILLANGHLSDSTKSRIVRSISDKSFFSEIEMSNYALFMLMIHPDYLILK